jgi:putative transcriptional regulator
MNPLTASPSALCQQLGERIKRVRLNQNLTQRDVAENSGLSIKAVHSTVAVLQVLGVADQLQLLMPEPPISPRQLIKLKGKERRRASSARSQADDSEPPVRDKVW